MPELLGQDTPWIETRDENELRLHIFQAQDRRELLVEVPEWQTKVLIKALSGTLRSEFLAFRDSLQQHYSGKPEYWSRLWFEIARLGCVHPKTKQPIFKVEDCATFNNEHDGAIIEMLGRTTQILSHLDASASERAKKNIESIPTFTMAYQLAQRFGCKRVAYLLERVSTADLIKWIVYLETEEEWLREARSDQSEKQI